jgi:uncharacterized protein YegL
MSSNNFNIEQFIAIPHNIETPLNIKVIDDDETFGIIKLNMKKTKIIKKPLFILFTIDITGSMSEKVYNNTSKLDFVKQTFVNMIRYLAKQEIEIYIQINTFNSVVEKLIDITLINNENSLEMIDKIQKLYPDGITNIGIALKTAGENMIEYKEKNETHEICHIFMSDGDPTSGEINHTKLQNLVKADFNNVFVGFGTSHNAELFNKFTEIKKSEYYFVDNLENTGFVYGEIIHQFIYPAFLNSKMKIDSGLLYDWRTNKWVSELEIDTIVSECEKIYHFKSKDTKLLEVTLEGIIANVPDEEPANSENDLYADLITNEIVILDETTILPDLIDINTGEIIEKNDLTKYIFRQRVQELLFIGKTDMREYNSIKKSDFKDTLKDIFKLLRCYMKQNDLLDDSFMKLLCDDICILYKSLNSHLGYMYTCARGTSQGRQTSYNVSSLKHDDRNMLNKEQLFSTPIFNKKLHRSYAINNEEFVDIDYHDNEVNHIVHFKNGFPSEINLNIDFDEEQYEETEEKILLNEYGIQVESTNENKNSITEDDLEYYVPSDNNTNCYSTPTALKMMRSFSQHN